MTGGQVLAVCAVLVFCLATTAQDIGQNDRLHRQQRTITRQQAQLDRDLGQIQQLNRALFDVPTITQGPTGGDQ